MFLLIQHRSPAGVTPVVPRRVVDLGLLGVNSPQRQRQSRVVTHNLNNLDYAQVYTGRSPITWRMNGEFVTAGGPRTASRLARQTDGSLRHEAIPGLSDPVQAIDELKQMDDWANNGVRLELMQGSRSLGFARITSIGDSGDVMENQTLTTRWSLTLQFESGGGSIADDVTDTDNPGIGRIGIAQPTGGPGTGGTGPGGMPMMPGPIINPPTPPAPTTTMLTLQLRNGNTEVPRDLSRVHPGTWEAPSTYTDPGDMMDYPVTTPYVILVGAWNNDAAFSGTGYGYYLWVEQWNPTTMMWEKFLTNDPRDWRWYSARRRGPNTQPPVRDEQGSYGHNWSFDAGPGTANTWWWIRARQLYKDYGAILQQGVPNPSGADYNMSIVSSTLGIFWGDYGPNSPPPNPPPTRTTGGPTGPTPGPPGQTPTVRAEVHSVRRGWTHADGRFRGAYIAPQRTRLTVRRAASGTMGAIYELPLGSLTRLPVRRGSPGLGTYLPLSIPRILYFMRPVTSGIGATPAHTIQMQSVSYVGLAPRRVRGELPQDDGFMFINGYSENVPPTKPTRTWQDFDGGHWVKSPGADNTYIDWQNESGLLASNTRPNNAFEATDLNRTMDDVMGELDGLKWTIVWLRAKYTIDADNDIFYSNPVGFVWPQHLRMVNMNLVPVYYDPPDYVRDP